VIVFIARQIQVRPKKTVWTAINSSAWDFQRIRHAQSVYNEVVDFKMLYFRPTNHKAPNNNNAQCKGSNCQRTEGESSNALRTDRHRADAH
jgi:hypothetical protein